MAVVYAAFSKILAQWGAEVGLTKHIYKLGVVADGSAAAAVEALNASQHAGAGDWKLLAKRELDGADEAALIERLARKEKLVEPAFYPRIQSAPGIFKVKLANVENHLLVKVALEGKDTARVKVKPADVGAYLIRNATGEAE
jgi:hypothetical protein